MFPDDAVRNLAVTAVNSLIARVRNGRIDRNQDLAEVIAACIRDTKPRHLDTLKKILDAEDDVPVVISPDVLRLR